MPPSHSPAAQQGRRRAAFTTKKGMFIWEEGFPLKQRRVYILAASTWIKAQPEAFTALIIAEAMRRQMVGSLQHNFVKSLHANTEKVSQPDLRDIIADVLIVSQITIGVGSLILADAL